MEHALRSAMIDRSTILLVAEGPTTCTQLIEVLQNEGFAVVLAADPDEALREAQTLVPDLILFEVLSREAQERMLARLRSGLATRRIPFVAMSRQWSSAAGDGQLRILKPDVDTLLEHVWRMVHAGNPGGSRSSSVWRQARSGSSGGG
jgi:CheY-like chemotaxis protein